MYVLTLELNNQCNLKCSYCYQGPKTGEFMDFETARKAVIYAVDTVLRQHNDRKLKINFLGGEPLISFELLTKIVNFCESYNTKVAYTYTITSNGLLLDETIINYLIKKKIKLKISMDGDKYVHDLNRISRNGTGSYDQLVAKFGLLNKYENLSQNYIQISNVITKNNYQYLCSSIKHNLSKGFRHLDSGIDSTDNWDDELSLLEAEIIAAIEYYIYFNTYEPVAWTFFNKILSATKAPKRLYSCGAGIISLYISPDGTAYPCPDAIGTEIKLGNVNEKITLAQINNFASIQNMENDACGECQYNGSCRERGCFVGNIKINGDMFKTSKFNCWFTKLGNKVLSQYTDIIKSQPSFSRVQ